MIVVLRFFVLLCTVFVALNMFDFIVYRLRGKKDIELKTKETDVPELSKNSWRIALFLFPFVLYVYIYTDVMF